MVLAAMESPTLYQHMGHVRDFEGIETRSPAGDGLEQSGENGVLRGHHSVVSDKLGKVDRHPADHVRFLQGNETPLERRVAVIAVYVPDVEAVVVLLVDRETADIVVDYPAELPGHLREDMIEIEAGVESLGHLHDGGKLPYQLVLVPGGRVYCVEKMFAFHRLSALRNIPVRP